MKHILINSTTNTETEAGMLSHTYLELHKFVERLVPLHQYNSIR